MNTHEIDGDPPIPVLLRRTRRARRMSLRVAHMDGRVTLTVPESVSDRDALSFAEEKADWIRMHLSRQASVVPMVIGAEVPVEGVPRRIVAGSGRTVRLSASEISVPLGRPPAARLKTFLREMARDRLTAASDEFANRLGVTYSKITLRDTRSRWGSCSSLGGLMYSWRLVMAPAPVLRYVAAHEVAHRVEMNHGPRFWATVETLCPDYKAPRVWLRRDGQDLHRYQFED
jgi:hypothetical protein